jgi:hypothetical protein
MGVSYTRLVFPWPFGLHTTVGAADSKGLFVPVLGDMVLLYRRPEAFQGFFSVCAHAGTLKQPCDSAGLQGPNKGLGSGDKEHGEIVFLDEKGVRNVHAELLSAFGAACAFLSGVLWLKTDEQG